MITRILGVLVVGTAVSTVGCEEKKAQPPLSAPRSTPSATSPPAPQGGPQSPHSGVPQASPQQAPPAGAALDSVVSALGVSVTLPATWTRNPPANQMRLAEAMVPGPGGDATKNCLVVFSTAGGSVEDNIARWSGQVHDAAGQPVKGKPESKSVGGIQVTWVELSGTFAGMGDAAPKDNWMLRGAIIEAPEGLLFVKMTGPAEEMAAASKDFQTLIAGIKKP